MPCWSATALLFTWRKQVLAAAAAAVAAFAPVEVCRRCRGWRRALQAGSTVAEPPGAMEIGSSSEATVRISGRVDSRPVARRADGVRRSLMLRPTSGTRVFLACGATGHAQALRRAGGAGADGTVAPLHTTPRSPRCGRCCWSTRGGSRRRTDGASPTASTLGAAAELRRNVFGAGQAAADLLGRRVRHTSFQPRGFDRLDLTPAERAFSARANATASFPPL